MPDPFLEPMTSILNHSSESSDWNSNNNVADVFIILMASMTSLNFVNCEDGDLGNNEPNSWP